MISLALDASGRVSGVCLVTVSYTHLDVYKRQAYSRNEFYIDLDTLSGVMHLLVGLWNILGIRKFISHNSLPSKNTIKPCYRAFIASLHELYPEDNKSCIGISSAHIDVYKRQDEDRRCKSNAFVLCPFCFGRTWI